MRVRSLQLSRWQLTTSTPQAEAAAFIRGNQVISEPTCLKCRRRFHWSHFSPEHVSVITLFSTCPFHCSFSLSLDHISALLACCARLWTGEKGVEGALGSLPPASHIVFFTSRTNVTRSRRQSLPGYPAKSVVQHTKSQKIFPTQCLVSEASA